MAFYQIDQDKNYMREMWGTSKPITDNDKEKPKRVIQEIMHDYAPNQNLKKQTELHERIRNDEDYDDWEYGTEPVYGKNW
jgi:polyhydroxyalkanoate synthesis regulator phasin